MGWEDRIVEAAYTSPSGDRIVFAYENLKTSTKRRTTAFEYPGVDGAYLQDNGNGARRFPLTCYFDGEDHDATAASFEAALLEAGVGRLDHPFYGSFDVVPFGDITRRDDLKTAANQSVIRVTFWQTLGAVYPSGEVDPRAQVEAALIEYGTAAGEQFEDDSDLTTTVARENVATRFASTTNVVNGALRDVAAFDADTNDAFGLAVDSLIGSIDELILTPLTLVQKTIDMTTLPARASGEIAKRLASYGALLADIVTSPPSLPGEAFASGVVLPGRRRTVANDFHSQSVFAAASVAGGVVAVLSHTFSTRGEALSAAGVVLDQTATLTAWIDDSFSALETADPLIIDVGRMYAAIQDAAALAAGFLVEISFTLLPERRIVLDRPRTIIDVAAEVYGAVDSRLDFLIESNDLSGSEILELPRGKVIVFYA